MLKFRVRERGPAPRRSVCAPGAGDRAEEAGHTGREWRQLALPPVHQDPALRSGKAGKLRTVQREEQRPWNHTDLGVNICQPGDQGK